MLDNILNFFHAICARLATMLLWTEPKSLESFVEQGSHKFPSSISVCVIGPGDNTNRIVGEFETVRRLNILSNTLILRVNTQNEIIFFLKLAFLKRNRINSILLYRWSRASFDVSVNHQEDHAFLNLMCELTSFREVNVMLQTPHIYQTALPYLRESECQEQQLVKSYVSRWKETSLNETT